jgi:hypothetical protein
MTTLGRGRVALAAAVAAALALTSCGGPPPPPPRRDAVAQWQDVFDGTPELLAIVRPQTIKSDPVYGSFWKTLLRVAEAKSEMGGVHAIEAIDQCEEVVVGVNKRGGDDDKSGDDVAIVLRGVPASLDPQKMSDANGRPLCHVVDEHAKVPELECFDRRASTPGAIFVLPDRTWVATLGAARARARQAFATPFGRPIPKAEEGALATLRLDANAFVKTRRLEKSAVIGPLAKKLRAVTLALAPAKGGLVVSLLYEDDDASAWSEMRVKQLMGELLQQQPQRFGWLKDAKVERDDKDGARVVVHVAIPPRLLEELPNAGGREMSDVPL